MVSCCIGAPRPPWCHSLLLGMAPQSRMAHLYRNTLTSPSWTVQVKSKPCGLHYTTVDVGVGVVNSRSYSRCGWAISWVRHTLVDVTEPESPRPTVYRRLMDLIRQGCHLSDYNNDWIQVRNKKLAAWRNILELIFSRTHDTPHVYVGVSCLADFLSTYGRFGVYICIHRWLHTYNFTNTRSYRKPYIRTTTTKQGFRCYFATTKSPLTLTSTTPWTNTKARYRRNWSIRPGILWDQLIYKTMSFLASFRS